MDTMLLVVHGPVLPWHTVDPVDAIHEQLDEPVEFFMGAAARNDLRTGVRIQSSGTVGVSDAGAGIRSVACCLCGAEPELLFPRQEEAWNCGRSRNGSFAPGIRDGLCDLSGGRVALSRHRNACERET